MTQGFAQKLSFGRKVLLACAGVTVIAVPVLFGLANASQNSVQPQATNDGPLPTFDVASVKPNHSGDGRVQIMNSPGGFRAINVTPRMLIEFAYNIKDPELSGGPSWINSERYDIDAKVPDAPDNAQALTDEFVDQRNQRRRQMMQALLADRFKLTVTHETKDFPIYNLVVAKGGPKFHETTVVPPDPAAPNPSEPPRPGQDRPFRGRGIRMAIGRGELDMNAAPMSAFADALSRQLGRNVVDKTELKGNYDLSLKFTPEEGQGRFFGGPPGGPDGRPAGDAPPPPDASGPSIFTALQEQLGLKLESTKGPVQTLVIASIEKPSEN